MGDKSVYKPWAITDRDAEFYHEAAEGRDSIRIMITRIKMRRWGGNRVA